VERKNYLYALPKYCRNAPAFRPPGGGQLPALAKRTGKEQLWTSAYYVGTAGSVSAETIRRYIMECQGK
jgi:REP element-mobilizing transposase RayT